MVNWGIPARDTKPGTRKSSWRWAVFVAATCVALAAASRAEAAPCGTPGNNEIVVENCNPGSPQSEWDVAGAGDAGIQGFATDISVPQAGTVHFKVDTTATDYRLDIYRMGYYGGAGARRVATVQPSAALPQNQPACANQAATGLIDCADWSESASWNVPADATSGIYFAKLVREGGVSGASHVVFVVRDDDGASDVLFQTSDPTWQAYNAYGGNSLYTGEPAAACLQGLLQPAVHHARQRPRGLGLQQRVPDGPLARAQRLRRQLPHRRRQRPSRRRAARARVVPVGRPRRVLVGEPARQRRRPRATRA